MSAPRFEVVRSDAPQPWHARFVAANGRIVWVTEQYHRRNAALNAVAALASAFNGMLFPGEQFIRLSAPSTIRREIREVDERGQS